MLIQRGGNPWLFNYQSKPQAILRLFCFPFAGSGASVFRTWSEDLPSQLEVCPIQLPGRENRLLESPYMHIQELVEPLGEALRPYLDLPFAFFGHSMGALLSFELARYLRERYQYEPRHLFVSAHRAPHLPDTRPPIAHLPEPEFITALKELKGTPEEVFRQQELLSLLLPVLRADFSICETYHYHSAPTLTCPISAYGGLQDVEIPRDSISAWKMQTRGDFRVRFFAGDHFYLHTVRLTLLQAIASDLSDVLGSNGRR